MKKYCKLYILLLTLACSLLACEDLDEVNINPNNAEKVSSNYLVSYVLTRTGSVYYHLGAENRPIPGAMQYFQAGTDHNAVLINQYGWSAESWAEYYEILRNIELIYSNSFEDNNMFFRAIALTMRSFVFGLLTDLYGDVPYTDALKAQEGTYFPAYDEQKNIYKGILEDLKEADQLLASVKETDAINPTTDVMFQGNSQKWRKFTNALRLRYILRVSSKKSEMSSLGINLEEEFKAASAFTFTSNEDDALIPFLGINRENSTPGGPINNANPAFYLKPGLPFLNTLVRLDDPRLHRWFQPVQQKWSYHTTAPKDTVVTNIFGETYTVKLVPASPTLQVDTSLFVGLPVGLPVVEAMVYNKGDDAVAHHPERSPYLSFLHERYRKNADPYIQMNLITYAEVAFIMAEAAQIGGFGSSDAEDYYKKGIRASMEKYGIFEAKSFDFDQYYAQKGVDLNAASNKHARIMEQKWIASWLSIQSWFDWRRTGYPDLKTGPVAQYGPSLPFRFRYPNPSLDPNYLVNYDAAVSRLVATPYIPAGQSKDHTYAKMWVLQEN